MNEQNPYAGRRNLLLPGVLSGILLGCSFPPIPLGLLAVVAFVPFFLMLESVERYWQALRSSYVTFLIFNVIALYWTGGFSHGKDWYMMVAGTLLLLVHPFFFCIPILAWVALRRRFGYWPALLSFPFLWVSFEYLHAISEIGFPWLIIGNSQAYDLRFIQCITFTGIYGISFLLIWMNVIVYTLCVKTIRRKWSISSPPFVGFALLLVLLYAIPVMYGTHVLNNPRPTRGSAVRIGIVQPNIDPFEKWQGNAAKQLQIIQDMTRSLASAKVDLVLWPETAVPYYVLHPANRFSFEEIKNEVDSLNVSLLTGFPDIIYYAAEEYAPKSSKTGSDGRKFESFNSSMLLQPGTDTVQKYAKIILVPFAERVPFSEALSFLNAMQWNFGLGGWGIGPDTTVFSCKTLQGDSIRFSNMICYESVYPGFVAAFVRKGAEFLTVITNDSWWGNTSGAYQHEQITALRAVENHRWVAQCANGGISCFIDPYGRIVNSSKMYTKENMVGTIWSNRELTFYSIYGDWLPQISLMLSLFLLMAAFGSKIYERIRHRQEEQTSA